MKSAVNFFHIRAIQFLANDAGCLFHIARHSARNVPITLLKELWPHGHQDGPDMRGSFDSASCLLHCNAPATLVIKKPAMPRWDVYRGG